MRCLVCHKRNKIIDELSPCKCRVCTECWYKVYDKGPHLCPICGVKVCDWIHTCYSHYNSSSDEEDNDDSEYQLDCYKCDSE